MTPTTVHHRICPLCEACCGLKVELSDGQVVRIRGDEDDPFSRGYLCPKGTALKELHEDPDRLRTPLIRRDGVLQPASWEEAYAEIQKRLVPLIQTCGRDAVALSLGNPNVHKMGLLLYTPRLVRALGSRNVFSASTLDQMPKQLSSGLMFGHWFSVAVPDIERCDHLLVLGANPLASNGSMWTVPDVRGHLKTLRSRGGRLVVIDPRRTETAQVADEHHAVRPGSDAALLAAIAQVLLAEGLSRPGRLEAWLAGSAEFAAAVEPFTPEAVAGFCGLSADTIRHLAHSLAAAQRPCVYGRIGTCTQRHGTTASWLIDAINILLGQLDSPGGAMFPKAAAFAANTQGQPGQGRGIVTGRHRSRVSQAPEVFGELPITLLAEEIETAGPDQVQALITVASNPVLSCPGGPRLDAALQSLSFMVSVDIYLNETTRHADVILPGLSPLEDSHYDVAFAQLSHRNHARYSPALLDKPEGACPEWEILTRLAAILMGQGAQADPGAVDQAWVAQDLQRMAGAHADAMLAATAHRQGPERQLDLALRSGPYGDAFGLRPDGLTLDRVAAFPHGIDLGALAPRLPEVLRTPSGRIEMAPSPCLDDLRVLLQRLSEPTPRWQLIGRREVRSNNSWMHNLPSLAKGPVRCTLMMHPEDAQALGVVEGDSVRITLREGREVMAPATVTDAVPPGIVSLPHGWGHDLPGARLRLASDRPGVNLNTVLDEQLRDPLSGNAVLSGVAVNLARA